MTIKKGDSIPNIPVRRLTETGLETVMTEDYFKGKKAVIFGVPGAFTPTCSARHLPGYVDQYQLIKDKGIDYIACIAVNDAFVMTEWGRGCAATDKIDFLSDGNAEFTRAMGLIMDGTDYGMGVRSQRYAMVIEDNKIRELFIDEPGKFEVSSAEKILSIL